MRTLEQVTENEMILAFIQAEVDAWPDRYRASGLEPEDFGPEADPGDASQNQRRRRALASARGYGQDQFLFRGLPNNVTWYLVVVTAEELGDFRYLNYPTFVQLTRGSRLVRDGGRDADIVEAEGLSKRILDLAAAVRNGERHPPLIAIASAVDTTPVVLEGNKRASAYVRELPQEEEVEVMLGVSPAASAMHFF
jgi:hypothetical protein